MYLYQSFINNRDTHNPACGRIDTLFASLQLREYSVKTVYLRAIIHILYRNTAPNITRVPQK